METHNEKTSPGAAGQKIRDLMQNRSKGSWLLATYLIPGCIGRGFKSGSESSSGGNGSGGGVWKSGNLKSKEMKFLECKSVMPKKMWTGSRLVGQKKLPDPLENNF